MLKEFKEFVNRGNVMDLAVAVIIGGAFGRIVSSLVDDIIMPFLGVLLGGINLTNLQLVIREAQGEGEALILHYGQFLQAIIDFFIIAFSVFLFIKIIGNFKKKEVAEEEGPPVVPREQVLLEEIRDILQGK